MEIRAKVGDNDRDANGACNTTAPLTPMPKEGTVAEPDHNTTPGKSPAFQFYPADFVAGTITLSTEEVGAYILLMCHAWDNGEVPLGNIHRARIARLTPSRMMRVWVSLETKFRQTGTGFIQPRIERERQKQIEYRERQAANGRNGGRPSKPKPNPTLSSGLSQNKPTANPDKSSSVFSLHTSVSSLRSTEDVPASADARSKRPIFKGQRFVIFEWQLDDLRRLLGQAFESFDVHSWFFELDSRAAAADLAVPQRDGGKWLQEQTLDEAAKRGIAIATTQQGTGKTAGNAAAAARFVARGQR
jgi:uncharacterized protein YdaU (DUF1376 family)